MERGVTGVVQGRGRDVAAAGLRTIGCGGAGAVFGARFRRVSKAMMSLGSTKFENKPAMNHLSVRTPMVVVVLVEPGIYENYQFVGSVKCNTKLHVASQKESRQLPRPKQSCTMPIVNGGRIYD